MKVMVVSLILISSCIVSLNAIKFNARFNQLGGHVPYSAVTYDQDELCFNIYGI